MWSLGLLLLCCLYFCNKVIPQAGRNGSPRLLLFQTSVLKRFPSLVLPPSRCCLCWVFFETEHEVLYKYSSCVIYSTCMHFNFTVSHSIPILSVGNSVASVGGIFHQALVPRAIKYRVQNNWLNNWTGGCNLLLFLWVLLELAGDKRMCGRGSTELCGKGAKAVRDKWDS